MGDAVVGDVGQAGREEFSQEKIECDDKEMMAGINTKGAKKDCFQMWEGISMIKDNEERISGNRREHSWTAFWQREFSFPARFQGP